MSISVIYHHIWANMIEMLSLLRTHAVASCDPSIHTWCRDCRNVRLKCIVLNRHTIFVYDGVSTEGSGIKISMPQLQQIHTFSARKLLFALMRMCKLWAVHKFCVHQYTWKPNSANIHYTNSNNLDLLFLFGSLINDFGYFQCVMFVNNSIQ